MKRRGFIFGIFSLVLYREFIRENGTIYLTRTLRTSDYSRVSIKNCKIKRVPWFSEGLMINVDASCIIENNTFYPV